MSLSLTPLDWLVCLLTTAGSLALGLYMAARTQAGEASANFFLAGRRLTWPVIGASMFATNIGAEHLVGLSGDAYRYGLCASTTELATVISLGIAAGALYPYYIRNKVFTVPEFLELRYNSACRMFFSGLMLVVCVMTKMAFTLYAGALVLNSMLGSDIMSTVVLIGVTTALFTMAGGFAGIAYTDTIQTAIMLSGCGAMLLVGLDQAGGWSCLLEKVPAAMHIARPYDDPNYPFWGIIAVAVYGGTFYWGADQVNVQRVLGASNLKQARWGAMFAVLLKLTPVFIFALPGVVAYALFPGREPKTTFVTLMNELVPSGLRGLVLAALLAALISSLDAVMNSVSTMVVRDFVLYFRPHTTERTQVWIGRLAILIGTVFGIGAAYLVYLTPEGLYKYLQTISVYLVLPITPAIIFGILSRRVTLQGATASVLAGFALSVVFVADKLMGIEAGEKTFPWLHQKLTLNFAYRGLWGTLFITATLFYVSAFTRKTAPEKLDKTTIQWSQGSSSFAGLADWRLQLSVLGLVTVALYWWLW